MLVDKTAIKDLTPVEGYKVFDWDWSCLGYDFKGNDGEIVGTVHKVRGDLALYKNWFCFCRKPEDCIRFKATLQSNKYALVRGYETITDNNNIICRYLEIVKELSFDEFYKLMPKSEDDVSGVSYSFGVYDSRGVYDSSGVYKSSGVDDSFGVSYSFGVYDSSGVYFSSGVYKSSGVDDSSGVSYSSGVYHSRGVSKSSGVDDSYGVDDSRGGYASCGVSKSSGVSYSRGVSYSFGVSYSRGVYDSYGVYASSGVSASCGVYDSYFVSKCSGIYRCICCHGYTGKLAIFNKPVSEERFCKVLNKIIDLGWYPKFNNFEELTEKFGSLDKIPMRLIKVREPKEAYADMPKELENYIKSLPEFDDEIWKKIKESR